MIVAKDTLGTINTHVISGLFKINKIQTTKMFTLKTISKSNTSFVYHIEVKVADETYFVEMRKHKLTSHKINNQIEERKYSEFLDYIFKYYLTFDHLFGLMNQDHYTALLNGDPDAVSGEHYLFSRNFPVSLCSSKWGSCF